MYELSSHWEELVENSCLYIHDQSQKTLASPFLEDEIDMHLNVNNYVPSLAFYEEIRQCFQFLDDQEIYDDTQSICSSNQ